MLTSITSEERKALYIEIIKDIDKVNDDNEKRELYSNLIVELKDMLIDSKEIENEEELIDFIEDIKDSLIKLYNSNEVILLDNNFDLESIKKSRALRKIKYESDITEIERLEENIKESENNIYSKIVPTYLIELLEKDLNILTENINELNKESDLNKDNIKILTELFNKKQIDKDYLIKYGKDCSKKNLKDIFERNFKEDYDEMLKDILAKTSNNIDDEIIKLEEDIKMSVKSMDFLVSDTSKIYQDLKNILESKEEKAQINKINDKVEITVKIDNELIVYTTNDTKVLNMLDDYKNETNQEEKEKKVEQIKQAILSSNLKLSTKSLPLQIELLNQKYDELKKDLNNEKIGIKKSGIINPIIEIYINNKKIMTTTDIEVINLYNSYVFESDEDKKEKLEQKIKDKILEIKEAEIKNKEDKLSSIKEKKLQIDSKKQLKKELDLIKELKQQKEAYYNILNDGINEFSEKENDENIAEKVEKFVNNHEQLSRFENYSRKKSIEKELIDQIKDSTKIKKVTLTEKMQKIWNKALKKALPFALGTAAGFKLSILAGAVPVVKEVLFVASVTKVTISTINKLADNAKTYEETGEYKGKMPIGLAKGALNLRNKIVGIVSSKKPNWIEKAHNMREKMKQTPINYFLNGVSIGYIAGNIYQIAKIKKIISEMNNNNDVSDNVIDSVTETSEPITDTITETSKISTATIADTITETSEMINFNTLDTTVNNLESLMEQGLIPKKGTVIDLSSILRGYISSDATTSVPLMEEVAKDVIFEKIKPSPTGELMCYFRQANGYDYGWVKLKDVLKVTGGNLIKSMTANIK